MILFKPAPGQSDDEARAVALKQLVEGYDRQAEIADLVNAKLDLNLGITAELAEAFWLTHFAVPLLIVRVIDRYGLDPSQALTIRYEDRWFVRARNPKPGFVPFLVVERKDLADRYAAQGAGQAEGTP